jgi:hypothetical protein
MTKSKIETGTGAKADGRAKLVQSVQTPLGFFVLVVLVVEVILGALVPATSGIDRSFAMGGMLLIIVALIATVAFLAYYRPEALRGDRPATNLTTRDEPSIAGISVKITAPRSGDAVPGKFPVEGRFKSVPKGYELWTFTTDRSGLSSRYWPQDRVVTRPDGTWSSQVYGIGGNPGSRRTFGIFLVGPDGQVLVDYWKNVGRKYVPPGEPWLPLTQLSRDIQKCDEVDVVVESGKADGSA